MKTIIPNSLSSLKLLRVWIDNDSGYRYDLLPIIAWDVDNELSYANAITPFGDETANEAAGFRVEVVDAADRVALDRTIRREWANLAASK